MQPIATPDKTIDSTIGSSAVARSQVERAVLERIGFHHSHFSVRIAVVLVGREGDVAVNAGEALELVEIAEDLVRLWADGLHRFGDQPRAVIAERNPPQERIAHVDLGALETVEESVGTIRQLAARRVADVAEIVRI